MPYFAGEYAAGRTPNPCVRCNDWLKFGKLHEYAQQIGADFVASGHYARIGRDSGGHAALLHQVQQGLGLGVQHETYSVASTQHTIGASAKA